MGEALVAYLLFRHDNSSCVCTDTRIMRTDVLSSILGHDLVFCEFAGENRTNI